MSFTCPDPRCAWVAHNGPHPTLANAVAWGCTSRPPRPYTSGDAVVLLGQAPDGTLVNLHRAVVHTCHWDIGRGWLLEVGEPDQRYLGAPVEADHVRPAGHVQPDIFDLLEAA